MIDASDSNVDPTLPNISKCHVSLQHPDWLVKPHLMEVLPDRVRISQFQKRSIWDTAVFMLRVINRHGGCH